MDTAEKIDVDKLEAGRELDALVAEYVFGWTVERFIYRGMEQDKQIPSMVWRVTPTLTKNPIPFSANIAAAFDVIEHLRKQNWYLLRLTNGDNNYLCWIGRGLTGPYAYSSVGDTAPIAICRAALKAVLATP